MEPNLAVSIYVRSSIKCLHFVPFHQQIWPPRANSLLLWNRLGQMEPNLAGSIYVKSKPGIDGPWVCPFQNCVWQPHPPFKMAAVFKVMIISLWNLLQYHSIVRWAIQLDIVLSVLHQCTASDCPFLDIVLSVLHQFTASDCPFLDIVLSVLHQFTASDCTFGIFKLFLTPSCSMGSYNVFIL